MQDDIVTNLVISRITDAIHFHEFFNGIKDTIFSSIRNDGTRNRSRNAVDTH